MLIFPCGIMRNNSAIAECSVIMIYRDMLDLSLRDDAAQLTYCITCV